MRERRLIPVSVLVDYLKKKIDADPVLRGVLLEGEISNLRMPSSGHLYFSLKDSQASITCVMFKFQASSLAFKVENGMHVIVTADVTMYEKEGRTQLRILTMKQDGIGDLFVQFEQLKKKLSEEGLFDPSHRKPLPKYPLSFGLITGNDTAARKDIYRTFYERWPLAKIHEYPTPVQGEAAVSKIIESLKLADANNHDVLLLVRGGGSIEDLWCFNSEALCRVIYDLHTPIVTGVGHETDTTLVDFVADVRANTPTGAVEIATPDAQSLLEELQHKKSRMYNAVKSYYQQQKQTYLTYANRPVIKDPIRIFENKMLLVDSFGQKLLQVRTKLNAERNRLLQTLTKMQEAMQKNIQTYRNRIRDNTVSMQVHLDKNIYQNKTHLDTCAKSVKQLVNAKNEATKKELLHKITVLNSYNPLNVLARGYSVTMKDEHIVQSIAQLESGDTVVIEFKDGNAISTIQEVKGK